MKRKKTVGKNNLSVVENQELITLESCGIEKVETKRKEDIDALLSAFEVTRQDIEDILSGINL